MVIWKLDLLPCLDDMWNLCTWLHLMEGVILNHWYIAVGVHDF